MKQRPLLTHNQLVDWLIYHCPIVEGGHDLWPFKVRYRSQEFGRGFVSARMTPWDAYEEMAIAIFGDPFVHREITDLYWYWTI